MASEPAESEVDEVSFILGPSGFQFKEDIPTVPMPGENDQPAAQGKENWADLLPGSSQLIAKPESVLTDGYMLPADADRVLREWASSIGKNNTDVDFMVRLATACCAGTSADTNFSERFLYANDRKTSLQGLVKKLDDSISYLALRANKLRVFCRSLPGFAQFTMNVIASTKWLARQRALAYGADVEHADVCFDYADALVQAGVALPASKLALIPIMRNRVVGEGRPTFSSGPVNDVNSSRQQNIRSSEPVSTPTPAIQPIRSGRIPMGPG